MRTKMIFGTKYHSELITPPLSGADMSPSGWGTDATYLSGGSFVHNSLDAHREYIFEWGGASSRESAMTMQKFRNGVYSQDPLRDLVYFISPNIEGTNVLPARWAQPSLNADRGRRLSPLGRVKGLVNTPTPLREEYNLPLTGVEVDGFFSSSSQLPESIEETQGRHMLFVPLYQHDYTQVTFTVLDIWADYGDSPGAGVYTRPVDQVTPWTLRENRVIFTASGGSQGIGIAVVGEGVKLYGMRATRIYMSVQGQMLGDPPIDFQLDGPDLDGRTKWLPGMGHSGCRFVGNPTWVENTGVNGGQIGYATTLREVGDWI